MFPFKRRGNITTLSALVGFFLWKMTLPNQARRDGEKMAKEHSFALLSQIYKHGGTQKDSQREAYRA